MSKKTNGVNYGKTAPQRGRRNRALEQLEAQLKTGVKTIKGSIDETKPLTEKDVTRINREIATLKSRI